MNKDRSPSQGKPMNPSDKKDLGREQVNTPKSNTSSTGRQSTETESFRSDEDDASTSSSSTSRR